MVTKTLNISLPQQLIIKVDRLAKRQAANRSEFIRDALRRHIVEQERWDMLVAQSGKQVRAADRNSAEYAIAEGLADLKAGRVLGPFASMTDFKKSRGAGRG